MGRARISSENVSRRLCALLINIDIITGSCPSLRSLFRELADGIVSRLRQLLENLHLDATEEQLNLIHSLSVGSAVVDPATQRPYSKRRVEAILESLFATLASKDKMQ
jgi:hypothetical protein